MLTRSAGRPDPVRVPFPWIDWLHAAADRPGIRLFSALWCPGCHSFPAACLSLWPFLARFRRLPVSAGVS
ncbi:MAG: hypothetical protein IKG39_09685, partial [Lachnospiraceae bacterium]|nr:hypothetical protein [Lachnospiraceae bacterium]